MESKNSSEIRESNMLLYDAWGLFTRKFPRADVRELPGISVTWAGAQWPMLNMIGLSAPIRDLVELKLRVGQAVQFAEAKVVLGMVVACKQWLPALDEAGIATAFAERGLVRAMTLCGMVADSLLPPRRPLPELHYRRVATTEASRDLADLNSMSYNAPLEYGREISDIHGYWDEGFAYVGYEDGRAVTGAVTMLVDKCLYVGWVATHPAARRKGYAEAVMRHSLDAASRASGFSRTILHASELGFPVYQAMGYRAVANFDVYFPEALVRLMASAG